MKPRPGPILIVDDDPVDREMIGLAFQRASVERRVVTVSDGQAALDYLTEQGPSKERGAGELPAVVVLDLNMPRMDGFEFLRKMKARPELAGIPVVVLTTSQFEQDLSRSYTVGANSYLTKPGNFEQLVEIARAIGTYWCPTTVSLSGKKET